MTAQLLAAPYSYFADSNGLPLAGGLIYTYAAGTTTPQAAYTDSTGGTPLSNPVVLDSAGRAQIWLSGFYKIVVKDSLGNTISTSDNITALGNTGNMNTSVYDPAGNAEQVVTLTATQTFTNKSTTTQASGDSSTKVATTAYADRASGAFAGIIGMLPTTQAFSSSTSATMTITAGSASDSTNAAVIVLPSTNWSIANGNAINGYSGGATLPNSTTIHFFACKGATGVGTFASNTLTPTLPTGYSTYFRRMFSINTNSSGVLLGGNPVEMEGGALMYWLNAPSQDISISSTTSASRTLYALGSVPIGIKLQPAFRFSGNSAGNYLITSPDEADSVPASGSLTFTATPGFSTSNTGSQITGGLSGEPVTTDTSAKIGIRTSSINLTCYWITRGYKDFRRS